MRLAQGLRSAVKELLGLLAVFLVIAFIVEYWQVIVGVIVLAGVAYAAYAAFGGWRQLRSEHREREAARIKQLRANANAQHHSYLQGFEHGVYGNYPPVDLDRL